MAVAVAIIASTAGRTKLLVRFDFFAVRRSRSGQIPKLKPVVSGERSTFSEEDLIVSFVVRIIARNRAWCRCYWAVVIP
jgi:hypothetical protein